MKLRRITGWARAVSRTRLLGKKAYFYGRKIVMPDEVLASAETDDQLIRDVAYETAYQDNFRSTLIDTATAQMISTRSSL
jgi:hypothetical protein